MFRSTATALLLALACIAGSTGCGKPATATPSRLIGKWQSDVDTVAQNAEQAKLLAEASRGQVMKTEVEFKSDGTVISTFTILGEVSARPGAWKVVNSRRGEETIAHQMAGQGGPTQATVKIIDDDTIEMIPPGSITMPQSIRFRRVASD